MDRDALLTDLYTRYARRIFGYFYWLTRDGECAADLMQETFLRVGQGLLGRPEIEPRYVWIRAIARNVLRAQARGRTWQRRPVAYVPFDVRLHDRAAPEAGPEARVLTAEARAECHARIRRGLAALTPDERRTVLLTAAGYDSVAIGARMGRHPNAVKQMLWRARHRARQAAG